MIHHHRGSRARVLLTSVFGPFARDDKYGSRAINPIELVRLPEGAGDPAATIVSSVGCPLGCNFCTTSAFFGGKGRLVNFFESGRDLFAAMCRAERALGVSCFFMMDENFLLYRRRVGELLQCMKQHGKSWSLYVFSSARAVAQYDLRELVELGINWICLGFESRKASYSKLRDVDTVALTRQLQSNGIRVHGSLPRRRAACA